MLHLPGDHSRNPRAAQILHVLQRTFHADERFLDHRRIDASGLGEREISCCKLILLVGIVMDGANQPVVGAHGKKINAEAAFPLDIRIRMGVLVQISHHSKKRGLIPVKTAPGVKAHIGLPVLLPRGYGKQHSRDGRRDLKVGKQFKFLRIEGFKICGKCSSHFDFHMIVPPFTCRYCFALRRVSALPACKKLSAVCINNRCSYSIT